MESEIAFRISVGLIAGVDDRPAPCSGRRHALPDMFGALGHRIDGAPGSLQQLAGPCPDLAADEERDQSVDHPLEVGLSTDQIILMAAVGIAGRVGVVLKEVHVAPDALFSEPFFG